MNQHACYVFSPSWPSRDPRPPSHIEPWGFAQNGRHTMSELRNGTMIEPAPTRGPAPRQGPQIPPPRDRSRAGRYVISMPLPHARDCALNAPHFRDRIHSPLSLETLVERVGERDRLLYTGQKRATIEILHDRNHLPRIRSPSSLISVFILPRSPVERSCGRQFSVGRASVRTFCMWEDYHPTSRATLIPGTGGCASRK